MRPEVGVGGLLDRGAVRVAGVVRDHVEAAELVESGPYGGPTRGCVGDVQSDRADLIAVLVDQVVELIGFAGGGDDPVAGGQDRFGEGAAEAAGTACDQPNSAHDDPN